jgi:hypothetical protein
LKDIAMQLQLPESSLRKYRDMFPRFIPYVGIGRDRKYREEAVEVFRAIREMREEAHLSWGEMTMRLSARFPMNPEEPAPEETQAQAEGDVVSEVVDRLEGLASGMHRISSAIDSQQAILTALGTEFLQMKDELRQLGIIQEDAKVVRRTLFSNHEYTLRTNKEIHIFLSAILDKVSEASAILLKARSRSLAVAAAKLQSEEVPVAPPVETPPPASMPEMDDLRRSLAEASKELVDLRDRLTAQRKENEHLRTRVAELTAETTIAAATSPRTETPPPRRGVTVLFRRQERPKNKPKPPEVKPE